MPSNRRELIPVPAAKLRDGDSDGHLMAGRRLVGLPRPLGDGRVELTLRWRRSGRTDRARVDADRPLLVRRATVGPGLPIRYRGRAGSTGELVEVHDTAHPDADLTAERAQGHRWALRCSHGTVVGRASLRAALGDAEDPLPGCGACLDAAPVVQTLPL